MKPFVLALLLACAGPALHAQETPAAAAAYARQQASIRGLLVKETAPGVYAATTSDLMATTAEDPLNPMPSFTQPVGESMRAGLQQVYLHMQTLHKLPEGHTVHLSFQEQGTLKDGASASLACALLMDSLLTGHEINPACAVTGSVSADGRVRAVGAVVDKLRAATKDQARLVIIPGDNTQVLTDQLLQEGPDALLNVDVHGVPDVATAIRLVRKEPDAALTRATETFAKIRTVVRGKKNALQLLASPKALELLASVVKDAPTHLSAQLLMAAASGKGPKVLSATASLGALKTIVADFIEPLAAADQRTRWRYWWWREGFKLELADELRSRVGGGLVPDELGKRIFELTRIRKMLDKRTVKLADTLQDFGQTLRAYGNLPANAAKQREDQLNRINTAWGRLREETQRLETDRDFQDDLLND